jgi:hypothetical protein
MWRQVAGTTSLTFITMFAANRCIDPMNSDQRTSLAGMGLAGASVE